MAPAQQAPSPPLDWRDRLRFGTYRLEGATAVAAVAQARAAGFTRFDTARLYKNESTVAAALAVTPTAAPPAAWGSAPGTPTATVADTAPGAGAPADARPSRVTTKLWKAEASASLAARIATAAARHGEALDRVLLHRPLPNRCWRALEAAVADGILRTDQVGVSNYDAPALTALLRVAVVQPAVNQIELHPFIGPRHELLATCAAAGVAVEAHSVLAGGRFLAYPPLVALARRLRQPPAAVLVAWALARVGPTGGAVVSSTHAGRLGDLIVGASVADLVPLADLAAMDGWHADAMCRLYTHVRVPEVGADTPADVAAYVAHVAVALRQDAAAARAGLPVSETTFSTWTLTSREMRTDPLAALLASAVFPLDAKSPPQVIESTSPPPSPSQSPSPSPSLRSKPAGLGGTAVAPLTTKLVALVLKHRQLVRTQRKAAAAAAAGRVAGPKRRSPMVPVPLPSSGDAACDNQVAKVVGGESCPLRRDGGSSPVSMVAEAIAHPTPMPVEIAPFSELAPLLSYLTSGGSLPVVGSPNGGDGGASGDHRHDGGSSAGDLTFDRGTLWADGRIDLCKQAVGTAHIGELCAAAARSPDLRHFLLGNNVACEGDGGTIAGAEALAGLMRRGCPRAASSCQGAKEGSGAAAAAAAAPAAEGEVPGPAIETWYLAGNGIDGRAVAVLAEALADNSVTKALWLKRNPLGADGGAALGRLLGVSPALKLLDISTCGMLDEGVCRMAAALTATANAANREAAAATVSTPPTVGSPRVSPLRHLYLDAAGVTADGLAALAVPIAAGDLRLHSLSLSLNALGPRGAAVLADSLLPHLPSLKRLDVGSSGLDADAVVRLATALLAHCPDLRFLGLGRYKSAQFFGASPNNLSDDGAVAVANLLREHPRLEVVDVSARPGLFVGLNPSQLMEVVTALRPNQSLVGIVDRHDKAARRRVRHPRRVVHIDSCYRT